MIHVAEIHRKNPQGARRSPLRQVRIDCTCGYMKYYDVRPEMVDAAWHQLELDREEHFKTWKPLPKRYQDGKWQFCKYYHELTPENVYVTKAGRRQCRTCILRRNRATAQKRKAAGYNRYAQK